MLATILPLSLLLHSGGLHIGAAGPTAVTRQDEDQFITSEETGVLECSMGPKLTVGSFTMFWYRQTRYVTAVEFIAKEYDHRTRFQASIDAPTNKFTLQITEPSANDSGTYYCIASHSDANTAERQTNTEPPPRA
ncbi:uncharacterized protein V6R79_005755 [Siganus canaliculatus]